MNSSFQGLLNTLVLALSLATIFLTLLTFLIFKIRQLPQILHRPSERNRDGVFFTRYYPFQKRSAEAAPKPLPVQVLLKYIPRRLRSTTGFFGVIAVLIFTTLGTQGYFRDRTERRAREKRAERVESLHAAGLLVTQELNPTIEVPFEESIPASAEREVAALLQTFQGRSVLVIGEKTGGWADLWRKAGAKVSEETNPQALLRSREADLLVLVEQARFSQAQKQAVEALLQRGTGVLAVGAFAVMDGKGGSSDGAWLQENFGIRWRKAGTDLARAYPAELVGAREGFWNLPPGLLLNWQATQRDQVATLAGAEPLAYEAEYTGRIRSSQGEKILRAVKHEAGHGRTAWIGMSPNTFGKGANSERFHGQHVMARISAWLVRQPHVFAHPWKKGAQAVAALSVDAEENFEAAAELRALFEKRRMPATFYIVSDLLEKQPELVEDAPPYLDFASHSADHSIFDGEDMRRQFANLQQSRLAIEERGGRAVTGFRPPEERFDEATLSVSVQNQIQHFFGDQRLYRFAPVALAEGRLLYYPRTTPDDFHLIRNPALGGTAALVAALLKEVDRIESMGGAYLLNLHTQFFGLPVYREVVDEFIGKLAERDLWRTNFGELNRWWRDREGVQITQELAQEAETRIQLIRIENRNAHPVEGITLCLDDSFSTLLPGGFAATLEKRGRHAVAHLSPLAAGERVELKLRETSDRRPTEAPAAGK